MTEINGMPAEGVNAAETEMAAETVKSAETTSHVTVRLSKLVEGVSLMFAGVLTMLESLDAGTAKKLTEGFALNDAADTAEGTGETTSSADPVDAANDSCGAEDAVPDAEKPGEQEKSEKSEKPEAAKTAQTEKKPETPGTAAPAATTQPAPAPSITVDEVAKIVVQKVKANHGINDKIRALVNSYGAQRVTELKPEVLEAFLTDLSQL